MLSTGSRAERYGNDNTPIRQLPYEILIAVFAQCVSLASVPPITPFAGSATPLEEDTWGDAAALRPIASVCAVWRSIALSSPSLWTTVTWTNRGVDQRSNAGLDRALDSFAACLQRSASLRIDVNIDVSAGEDHVCTRLRDACEPHLDRIRSLRYVSRLSQSPGLFFPLAGKMSALRLLHVQILGRRTDIGLSFENNAPLLQQANEAPLETLSLVGAELASSLREVGTGHLRELVIAATDITDAHRPYQSSIALTFIASCPNLRSVWLGLDGALAESVLRSHPHFDCAHLQTCHLSGHALNHFPTIVHAPRLRSLILSRPGINANSVWVQPAPVLTADSLHSLSVNGDDYLYPTVSYVVSTLQQNNHLVELRLKTWSRTYAFLSRLAQSGSGSKGTISVLAPSLETLVLDACMLEGQTYRVEFGKAVQVLLAREGLTIWLDKPAFNFCSEYIEETGNLDRLRLLSPS